MMSLVVVMYRTGECGQLGSGTVMAAPVLRKRTAYGGLIASLLCRLSGDHG